MALTHKIIRLADRYIRNRRRLLTKRYSYFRLRLEDKGWKVAHYGSDRTAYVIGLFGSGRWYLSDLILDHIGKRAKYFRDSIRLHPGPTSMIYSGHATLKYPSRQQAVPEETAQIVDAVHARTADSIFIYRHPLDSLLTNWLWWRNWRCDGRSIWGITQVYPNERDFCVELEANFADFEAFAAGDPAWLGPGMRFLSFAEFVEETELHVQCASLPLRLEDFIVDPRREFARVVEVISARVDTSRLSVARPQTTANRYRSVTKNSPRFAAFIDHLDADTKHRIERLGYSLM
jgi:hypothetical protein